MFQRVFSVRNGHSKLALFRLVRKLALANLEPPGPVLHLYILDLPPAKRDFPLVLDEESAFNQTIIEALLGAPDPSLFDQVRFAGWVVLNNTRPHNSVLSLNLFVHFFAPVNLAVFDLPLVALRYFKMHQEHLHV